MKLFRESRLYIIVLVIALTSWGLAHLYAERNAEMKSADNNIDYFSSGYIKQQMDKEGLPENELIATTMRHTKNNGETFLEKPEMSLYNPNEAPWVIQSETGLLAADGDHLMLNGHTHIARAASAKSSALTINTSDLRVKLSTHYAETEAWAEIISPPHKTYGTGMQTTFVSPIHLNLLSKVKGRYEFN